MVATLLIGLSIAMLLFLLAAGLSLIFGMLGVVNFAHGALYMVGAFVACEVATRSGSFWLALAVAPIVVAGVGIVIEVGLLRPLYARAHVQQLMLTFGLILVLDEILRLIWGVDYRIIIDCFIVVVIGGLGSVRGTAVAALLLGLTQAFGQYLAPGWIEVWTLLVMIAVLLFRPQGLFGVKSSRVA